MSKLIDGGHGQKRNIFNKNFYSPYIELAPEMLNLLFSEF